MSSALAVERSSSASMVFIFLAIVSYLFSDSVSVYWASFSCCSSPSMLSTFYRCHYIMSSTTCCGDVPTRVLQF